MPRAVAPVYLGEAEVERIINKARTERDRLLFCTLFMTGGRITEVLSLTPRMVRDETLYLPTLKQAKRPLREVAVPTDLVAMLRLYIENHRIQPEEPVFQGRRGRLTRQAAWRNFKAAAEMAGVERIRDGRVTSAWTHLARHSYAHLVKSQVSENAFEVLQKQLGHADIRSTLVYGQVTTQDRVEAIRGVHFTMPAREG